MRSGGSNLTSHFREAQALFALHIGLLSRISLEESRPILKEREGKVGSGERGREKGREREIKEREEEERKGKQKEKHWYL